MALEKHGKPRGRGRGLGRGGLVFPPRGGRGLIQPPEEQIFSFTSPPNSKKDESSDSEPENEADNA